MFRDIFHNHLICYIARCCSKVPSSPDVSSPKCTVQSLEFHHHLARTLPFDILYQLADRYVWWNRYPQMKMISGKMTFDDLHIVTTTNLTDQFPGAYRNLSLQNWLEIFRDPYQMMLYIIDCVTRLTIVFHIASLLKFSPKGEGFSPIPQWGQ